jgi:uncharacterized membrane protein
MNRKAKLLGHPIHQMLIVFPLGLLATAVVFDLITLIGGSAAWSDAAFYMIGAGIIGGLLAAVFGLWDWLTIPSGTRAKSVGAWHGIGNVVVVVLFSASWMLRYNNAGVPNSFALACSFVAAALALVTGWLGGELVDRLGVGVDANANLNAPSSLRDRSYDDRSKAA